MSQDQHIPYPARAAWFVSMVLTVLTLLVYSRSFSYPFVDYDDNDYVFKNPQVQAGLNGDSVRWAFMTFHASNWHPLTWLSLQLDATLFGGQKAGGFHVTNVI